MGILKTPNTDNIHVYLFDFVYKEGKFRVHFETTLLYNLYGICDHTQVYYKYFQSYHKVKLNINYFLLNYQEYFQIRGAGGILFSFLAFIIPTTIVYKIPITIHKTPDISRPFPFL